MSYDYLKEIPEVVALLQSEGLDHHAAQVKDAFETASTSTELLMGVRFYLQQIPTRDVPVNTRIQIETLISAIDTILNR